MTRLMLATLALVMAAGCEVVVGNGDLATEERTVGRFDGIRSTSLVDVQAQLAVSDFTVELVCDANLLPYIEASVDGDVLEIAVEQGIVLDPQGECTALVTAQSVSSIELTASGSLTTRGTAHDLASVELTGSGSLSVEDIDTVTLAVEHTSSGRMELDGDVRQLDLFQSGSGLIEADRLKVSDAQIVQTGSGNIDVDVSGDLEVTQSGSGNITIHGNPSSQEVTQTGSGNVDFE